MNREKQYAWLLTGIYFVIALTGILRHELWLDESHHWLMARDSGSLAELIRVTRPDGHPVLWNMLLYFITRFTHDIIAMQVLHVLIATAAIFVFVSKAPFPWIFKLLFIFGYFMIFEYCLISRNYMPGILFLFLACSIFRQRHARYPILCFYLVVAANVHLMFCVISLAFFATLLLDDHRNGRLFLRNRIFGYIVFCIGLFLLALQMATTKSDWFFTLIGDSGPVEKLSKAFISLFKGLIAIPDFRSIHFWNVNLIIETCRPLAAAVAILLFAVPLLLFYKKRKVLFFSYLAIAGSLAFYFVTLRDATRFYGLSYLIVIIGLWLSKELPTENSPLAGRLDRWKLFLIQKPVVYAILIIHFLSGIIAYSMDFRYAFTPAKEVAEYIQRHYPDKIPVVCVTCEGTSISPYLDRKIWFLCTGSYQSYCQWESICRETPGSDDIMTKLSGFMKTNRRAVYVSYKPLPIAMRPNVWVSSGENLQIKYLAGFNKNTIVPNEYYVFEISRAKTANNTAK